MTQIEKIIAVALGVILTSIILIFVNYHAEISAFIKSTIAE